MNTWNKIKVFVIKYKYFIIAVPGGLFILIFLLMRTNAKHAFLSAVDFFNAQMKKYRKYRDVTDNKALEQLEKIEKRKDEIKKEINEKFKENEVKIKEEEKAKVKKELEELEGNEDALEDWYNNFLNGNTATN